MTEFDCSNNPVFLISGELPGSGATTLAALIGKHILSHDDIKPELIFVGQRLREELGVATESEMADALANIPDPTAYDHLIYSDLPDDRPVIVEGKLATQVGPQYIDGRPIVCIDLDVHPFQSAVRVMGREGTPYETVFASGGSSFMDYYRKVSGRARHISELRQIVSDASDGAEEHSADVTWHRFDTTLVSADEIMRSILGVSDEGELLGVSTLSQVTDFAAWLSSFSIKLNGKNLHPLDKGHFNFSMDSLTYQMRRLEVNRNGFSDAALRKEIKDNVIDSVFSLFMKSVPRFYEQGSSDEVVVDDTSQKWTPEFYKIAMAMPTLKAMIKDKHILDPFGGAGSLMFYLAAKGIPKSVICSDICYPGGKTLSEDGQTTYGPTPNQQSILALFASLPSWCRPNFSRIKGFATADANKLPFRDKSFDLVVGDPPYGKNCAQGSALVLTLALPELLRVSRDGVLSMVPADWVKTLQSSSYNVTKLTEDLSSGTSNLPTCYVLIQAQNT